MPLAVREGLRCAEVTDETRRMPIELDQALASSHEFPSDEAPVSAGQAPQSTWSTDHGPPRTTSLKGRLLPCYAPTPPRSKRYGACAMAALRPCGSNMCMYCASGGAHQGSHAARRGTTAHLSGYYGRHTKIEVRDARPVPKRSAHNIIAITTPIVITRGGNTQTASTGHKTASQ
jgi:hypothetical protein